VGNCEVSTAEHRALFQCVLPWSTKSVSHSRCGRKQSFDFQRSARHEATLEPKGSATSTGARLRHRHRTVLRRSTRRWEPHCSGSAMRHGGSHGHVGLIVMCRVIDLAHEIANQSPVAARTLRVVRGRHKFGNAPISSALTAVRTRHTCT
jgi:hypothetical protein